MSAERVTACLIVQNEQERLPAALDSVAFCDQVIVVDGGSTDGTVELARRAGATVIENPWPGFAAQRNVALDAADSDWILELDADERISTRLRTSIEELLAAPAPVAAIAVCPLRHRFLGRALGPSGKYPAYRARVFRRGSYRHDEARMVHEGIEPHERPIVLEGDLEHELAATLREGLRDTWNYARLESSHLTRPSGPRAYLTGIVLRPAVKLAYRTIVEGGWHDGWQGLLKIALDATSDALVWTLVLLRGVRTARSPDRERASAPSAASRHGPEHFGRRPSGPVKVVGIATGGDTTQTATRWLADLQARGLDVVLISPEDGTGTLAGGLPASGVPTHPIERPGPLALIRALEVEMQLRTTDAVVPVGRRARLLLRFVPRTLRPEIPGLKVNLDPERTVDLASAHASRS